MLTPAENLYCVLRGGEPEWIPVECLVDPKYGEGAYRFVTQQGALAPREGGQDPWGVTWTGTAEFLPYPSLHPAETIEQALTMRFPDVHDPARWEPARRESQAVRGQSVIIARQVCALFERFWALVGMEKAFIGIAAEPELVYAVLERIADWQVAAADHFIEIGVQAARISDDYGAQNNLMISPAAWRQLVRPHLARLVERYRAAGLPIILHSCGNLTRIMDDLMELEFAALNIQVNANDLPAMKKRYGRRFCVWGGVSTQRVLACGTPHQVRKAVEQAVTDLGYDGGLILEPDQVIQVPEENLRAFSQAAQELKRQFRRLPVV
jgi:uroporphyrinogen decarboxylase